MPPPIYNFEKVHINTRERASERVKRERQQKISTTKKEEEEIKRIVSSLITDASDAADE